jgi:glycolate oxidase
LEAVLPTGEIIHTGVRTAKGVVGYDLTRLIIGSEGTLAVISAMTLKLLPLPETVGTLTASFKHMENAADTVSEIIRRSYNSPKY